VGVEVAKPMFEKRPKIRPILQTCEECNRQFFGFGYLCQECESEEELIYTKRVNQRKGEFLE
jgi:hypothetical protein